MLVVKFKLALFIISVLMKFVRQLLKNGLVDKFLMFPKGEGKIDGVATGGAIINKLLFLFNLSMGFVMSYFLDMM